MRNFVKERVLIVEDDCFVAMLLSLMLEEIGFEICGTAVSEDDAVNAAIQHQPQLVISDFHLARGDGVSACERIQHMVDVPVLFVSGNSDEVRELVPEAICVDKPYTLATIKHGILAVLASRESCTSANPIVEVEAVPLG